RIPAPAAPAGATAAPAPAPAASKPAVAATAAPAATNNRPAPAAPARPATVAAPAAPAPKPAAPAPAPAKPAAPAAAPAAKPAPAHAAPAAKAAPAPAAPPVTGKTALPSPAAPPAANKTALPNPAAPAKPAPAAPAAKSQAAPAAKAPPAAPAKPAPAPAAAPAAKAPAPVAAPAAKAVPAAPATKAPAPVAKPAAPPPAVKPAAAAPQPATATAAAPAAPAGPTIDFTCAYCDEQVKVGLDMEGKQTPCPACKRIIKVPMQVKQAPKDWRTIDTRPGGLLRKDAVVAPKDAWGTEATVSNVSQAALEEAGALPEDLEPPTLGERLKWPLVGLAAAAVLTLLFFQVRSYFAGGDRNRALALALETAYPPDGKEPLKPEAAAVVHRALGEFYGRSGRADHNAQHTEQGLAELRSATAAASQLPPTDGERDCQLRDTALTLVDLGGELPQVKQGTAILWEPLFERIRETVAGQQTPEARAETLRQLTQKLAGKTDVDLSSTLTSALTAEEAKPEARAVVGLELWRLNRLPEAETAATRAQILWDSEAARAKTSKLPPPAAPSLVALWLVLKKPERAEALKADDADGTGAFAYAVGSIESQARLGQLDKVRAWAKSQAGLDQLRYLALIAALGLEQEPTATADLDGLVKLVQGSVKSQLADLGPAAKTQISCQLLRVVRQAARAGHEEQAKQLAQAIPDLALRGRAQLEILRARMARGNAVIDDDALNEVDPKSPAHRTAREEYARYKAHHDGWNAKNIDAWEAEWKPFGYAGVALGIQDRGQ
ncbi:MAG: hypothetical protein JNM56_01985, partial [Planctomycetia bacterium]|nr:hypothetical protein [Planctomycetia bacterium]